LGTEIRKPPSFPKYPRNYTPAFSAVAFASVLGVRAGARRTLIGLICGVALLGVMSGAASAANWSEGRLPAKQLEGGYRDPGALYSVSCATESLCVAVGALDTVAVSRSPSGGAAGWQVSYPLYPEPDEGCLEEDISAEKCREPRGSLDAVSCASESFCVAVAKEGSIYVSTDPAGGAGAWSIGTTGDGSPHLTSVSCPSESLCVAVSGERGPAAGRIVTSTDPGAGQWQTTQLPGAPDLRAVSCSGTALCVAAAAGGKIFVSTDPTGGASAWREVSSPTPRDLRAVSCVVGLCAAGDGGGNILTSTNPTGGGFAEANGGGSIQVTGLSCPTAGNCVAVDENGDVLASTNPTGSVGAWSFQSLIPFEAESPDTGQFVGNALWGTSCPTTSLCVLVGAESRIFTSAEPFAAPTRPSTGASTSAAGASKQTRPRPHTHLVYAEGFWKGVFTRHHHAKARFHFYSREGAKSFECKRDGGRWRRCHSPLRYWVTPGRHVLRVRAIGRTGLRGPVAALPFRVVGRHVSHR
jgi:hypothetical protein